MPLKVERISLASVVASWPSVLTRPTRSPFLSGRIRLKDTEPPQAQLPPLTPPCWPMELCSLWTLRLDTDKTACTRSPCLAVSSPEIRYRPSRGAVKIPVEMKNSRRVCWIEIDVCHCSVLLFIDPINNWFAWRIVISLSSNKRCLYEHLYPFVHSSILCHLIPTRGGGGLRPIPDDIGQGADLNKSPVVHFFFNPGLSKLK